MGTIKAMNISFLETFLLLCETKSFSETARRLNLSQPSVSRQIRLIEEEVGSQLFIRTRQAVALSPSGSRLLNQVGPLAVWYHHLGPKY